MSKSEVIMTANIKSISSKIKKAKEIYGKIFMLYDEKSKLGNWELDKASDAISSYIKELESSL